MTEFLNNIFKDDDNSKYNQYVDDESKNNECQGHPLHGCRAAQLITFKPDGSAELTVSLKNLDTSFNTDEVEFDASNPDNVDNIGE